ncbi:porin family protein [Paracnuella aquatica]|uniref:porin family protein n=1 Tax=Paracnuella aquatica TaxID=2268757 RepID=UPI00139068AC|nr:porin family protein [Paracnuella aquatica]
MKRIALALCALSIGFAASAQTDTTKQEQADTVRIGGMVIIRKNAPGEKGQDGEIRVKPVRKSNSKVNTNWWIVDLGFANWSDNTNYSSPAAQAFAPGFDKDGLELRTGKSINVNLWVFMQKVKLIQNAVSLKYGLGVELNNYRFDDRQVRLEENPTRIVKDATLTNLKKNKLAADYVTVPLMLNFNFTPKREKGFGFAAGVSGGYLYSARQKFKTNDNDIDKNHDNFDLRKFKVSYIGELSLGVVRLYGSYATKSMWEKGLDQTPYNIGIRLSYF